MKKWINKKTVGGAILVLLVLLIFASRTIYAYNLPSVTATKPSNGRISKEEKTTGLVDYARSENIYTEVGGKVDEVLVKEGDAVAEGQALLRFSFDRSEVERKLEELGDSRARLAMDIENIQMQISKTRRSIETLKSEDYTADEVSDTELAKMEKDIQKAIEELDNTEFLFELGEASANDVQKARDNINTLTANRDDLKKSLDEQREKNRKTVDEKEKVRASQLADYEDALKGYNLQLQGKQLDQRNYDRQEAEYREQLADFNDNTEITAPAAGIVTSLQAEQGQSVNANMLIATIGVDEGYILTCAISLDNNFVLPGDTCSLTNTSRSLKGTVTAIEPDAQSKTVSIEVLSDEVTAGETFEISFEKDSDASFVLVPNGALNQDSEGYYVNQIKRRDGLLGQEYYLVRQDVYIGEADASNTAILQGIRFFEPIVLISDKAVSPGDVVSLSNASDFFES